MFSRYPIFFLVVAAVFLLCVRPARADGTVFPSYNYMYTQTQASASCAAAWAPENFDALELSRTESTMTFTCRRIDNGFTQGNFTLGVPYECPALTTGNPTSGCVCIGGYHPHQDQKQCIQNCPETGTIKSTGYYDIGTDSNSNGGLPPRSGCDSNCYVQYSGSSVGWRVLVSGVYHYYAKGEYIYDSSIDFGSCYSGSSSIASVASAPANTCGAGQSLVTGDGGYAKCFNDSGVVDSNSASAVASAKALADAAAQKIIDDAVAAAKASAAAAGGSASAVEAAGDSARSAAGAAAATIIYNNAAAEDKKYQTESEKTSECDSHPDTAGCVELGSAPAAETVAQETPLFDYVPVAFATVAGCPAPIVFDLDMPFLTQSYSISFDALCTLAGQVKPIFLALASITAAIIFMAGLSL